jgi:cytochrome c5
MKKIITILSLAFLVACAAYKPLVPTQADAERAGQKFPGTTLAGLNEGKTIFESHCNKCHSLNRPFKKTEAEIRAALPKMAQKAKIDSTQEDLVLKFLLTMNTNQAKK